MEIKKIIEKQLQFDLLHGFETEFDDDKKKYAQLTKDLVGLFGEIGEFSNIVKKINLLTDYPEIYPQKKEYIENGLAEELADSFIYIIRIASILNIDLEKETLKKIKFNEIKYKNVRK